MKTNTMEEYITASKRLQEMQDEVMQLNISLGNTFTKGNFNGFVIGKYIYNARHSLKTRMLKQCPPGLNTLTDEEIGDMF